MARSLGDHTFKPVRFKRKGEYVNNVFFISTILNCLISYFELPNLVVDSSRLCALFILV
jgi:hypothetical protein